MEAKNTFFWFRVLTHLPPIPHIFVCESGQYWFRLLLVAYSAPCQYLNQCWVIVIWTLESHFSEILIQENAFGNIVSETMAILSREMSSLTEAWKKNADVL